MRPICWLHISDLHLSVNQQWSQDIVLKEMCRHIKQQRENGKAVDFILVTGDIAYSGKDDEYVFAKEFFDILLTHSGVRKDRVFCVPGNHDIDRSRQRNSFLGARGAIRSGSDLDGLLVGGEELTTLLQRQENYRKFQEAYFADQNRTWTSDGLAYVSKFKIEDVWFAIVGLDSAWLAEGGESDHGKLLIGERQAFNAIDFSLNSSDIPHVLIAMAHHPFRLLQEFDRLPIQHRFERDTQFFHHGHLHQAETRMGGPKGSQCLTVAVGASFAGRENYNSYSSVLLDLLDSTRSVRSFQYNNSLGTYSIASDVEKYPIEITPTATCEVAELAKAMVLYSPTLEPLAHYISALVLGQKTEFPIAVENGHAFGSIDVVSVLDGNDLAMKSIRFMRFRNILNVQYKRNPLQEILENYGERIAEYAAALNFACMEDADLKERLAERDQDARRLVRSETQGGQFHTLHLFEELEESRDWIELREQAERHVNSPNSSVSVTAKRMLAFALLNIGESRDKRRAIRIYKSLAESTSTVFTDLANLALLMLDGGYMDDASKVVFDGLSKFPESRHVFFEIGQKIVVATGNRALRKRIDRMMFE